MIATTGSSTAVVTTEASLAERRDPTPRSSVGPVFSPLTVGLDFSPPAVKTNDGLASPSETVLSVAVSGWFCPYGGGVHLSSLLGAGGNEGICARFFPPFGVTLDTASLELVRTFLVFSTSCAFTWPGCRLSSCIGCILPPGTMESLLAGAVSATFG